MWQSFLSTKLLMTAGMLLGVFALKFRNIDVSDLSIVLPLILAFYTGGNVMQDYVNKKYGKNSRAGEA